MAADIHHYIQERISPDIMDIHEEFRRVALDNGIPYIPFPPNSGNKDGCIFIIFLGNNSITLVGIFIRNPAKIICEIL